MEFFVWFNFLMAILAIILGVIKMSIFEFPKKRDSETLGMVVGLTLMQLCIAAWTGFLLFVS